ncbi:MAG: acetylornithine/succinylornithine family transaminase [Coriobacteriia bacterium]|nr:acetylornithine/succinylornithine family transaminase [Coriobacteriia bacterium]
MHPATQRAVDLDARYAWPTYARKPVLFERGSGMRLYDAHGVEHLDFVAGIGVVNLGHAHPAVARAVQDQVSRLVQVSNLYHVEHRAELEERLCTLFGEPSRVFLCNSGTEAVEAAIKLARAWGRHTRGDGCYRIVAAERSFHGRTFGALSATGQAGKQQKFAPLLPGFTHVPLNDLDALADALADDVCAVLLEPVQGEGGVYPCEPEYLRAVRTLCDEREVLLVLDEVQTGLYRTGPLFAHRAYGITPDVMTLAKALANGLPAGAAVARAEVAEVLSPGDHGSTFAGGPVVCAAALATLDALDRERLGDNAERVGAHLRFRLMELADRTGAVTDVRGRGLMVGASLARPIAREVADAALKHRVLVNATGEDTLRFLPPLVCTESEVDTLVSVLEDILRGR